MEVLVVLLVAALVLPPRYALRLGGAGVVAVLALAIYSNASPGHGSDPFGQALLVAFSVLFFGAIMLGLVLRWVWNSWHKIEMPPEDLSAPLADQALAFLAMVLPAGVVALWLGNVLSGNSAPLRTHVLLLGGLAAMALLGLVLTKGLSRAGLLGFAAFMAVIVVDSMRLESQIAREIPLDLPHCLAIGPDRLSRDQSPPLMGLTAPKPILMVVDWQQRLQTERWSFRWHGFVRGGTGHPTPPCTPALP